MDDTSDQDDPNYRSCTESDYSDDESDGIRVRKKKREKFR